MSQIFTQDSTTKINLSHLNWLRFFCICCIFLLHTGITFSYIPDLFPFWHISSQYVSVIITGFCAFANSACMPLFFLLSGMGGRLKIQSGDELYYNRRSKKWLIYLLWIWPLIGLSIWSFLNYLSPNEIYFDEVIFPNPSSQKSINKTGFTIPLNLFHLWYLFVLLFIEGLMKFIYPLIIKKFNWLFLLFLPCLQTAVILIQNQGYMTTPIIIDSLNFSTIFVYGGWYTAGFLVPSLIQSQVNSPKMLNRKTWISRILNPIILKPIIVLRIFYSFAITAFFISKFPLLFYDFNQLNWVTKLVIALFDSLIPWAVLGVWYELMNQSKFHRLTLKYTILERLRITTIKYALEIYVLQIPVIFGILSVWGKFNGQYIFFQSEKLHKSTESLQAFSTWMILTFISAIIIAFITELKHITQSIFKPNLQ